MSTEPAPSLRPPDPNLPGIDQLTDIVAQLRGPGGCPWDREQTHASLRSALLEEAHEVVAAIDNRDDANLREELGDLLLQSVFHAQLAAEEGRFTFNDVAREIATKLVRRHPHVFAADHCADSAAVLQRWEEITRAEKGDAAASVGFDWPDVEPVFAKLHEEISELRAALTAPATDLLSPISAIEDELGDLLFTVVNLARKLHLDAETALHRSTRKFSARFRAVEQLASARGITLEKLTLAELDQLWDEVKRSS